MISRKDQLKFLEVLGLHIKDVLDMPTLSKQTPELDPFPITDWARIKTSWKKLAKKYHPDHYSEKEYEAYQKKLEAADKKGSSRKDLVTVLSLKELDQKFCEVTHAYKMLVDPSYSAKKENNSREKNLDAVFNIVIDFEQAFFGDSIIITFNPIYVDDEGSPVKIDKGKDIHFDAEILSVRIRPGVSTGDQVKIEQKGLCKGDRRGNLILTLQVVPHPTFVIKGPDILEHREIPLDVMLVGGEMEVPTMWGPRTLVVPSGSRPGDQVPIKNCGVSEVGSHIIKITPEYPSKDTLKEKSVWQKLGIKWKAEQEVILDKEEGEFWKRFTTFDYQLDVLPSLKEGDS